MFGFIIALAAGFVTPTLEESLARPVAKALAPRIPVQPNEMRLLAFMIAMLIAVLIAGIFSTGSPLGLLVGGILGYFGQRIIAAIQGTGGSKT